MVVAEVLVVLLLIFLVVGGLFLIFGWRIVTGKNAVSQRWAGYNEALFEVEKLYNSRKNWDKDDFHEMVNTLKK
jgi:hypothetical protein